MIEHGWAYQMRFRLGPLTSTDIRVAGELRDVNGGNNPETLLERTDEFTITDEMHNASDGSEIVRPLRSSVRMRNAIRYGYGFVANDARIGYGLLPASSLPSTENKTLYKRTLPTPTPNDPMGYTSSSSNVGRLSVAIDYEPNVKPEITGSRSPLNAATGVSLTPTFTGDFRDDNRLMPNGLAGDGLNRAHILLYNDDTDALVWDFSYLCSIAERAAEQWTKVYDGPALSLTTTYRWQARVQDLFGAWSDFSSPITFTCGGPVVSVIGGPPAGKIETTTPTLWLTYTHASDLDCHFLQAQVLDGDSGRVLRECVEIIRQFPAGSTVEIPWYDLHTGVDPNFIEMTPLEWGGHYAYQVRAKDSADLWSRYSPPQDFTVNAAPSVPAIVAPDGGDTISSLPEVVVIASDADDTPATGHVVSLEIRTNGGTLLQTRSMTLDSSLTNFPYPIWRYQLISADIATTGTYRLKAYAYDGTIYSGEKTSSASATRSDEVVFTFSAGPVITHVSPANNATINTNTPLYDWSVSDQVKKQVLVFQTFEDGSELLIYDSGVLVNATTSHLQPEGYLEDDTTYYRKISVWNSLNQRGDSPAAFFIVSYTKPDAPTNFVASGYLAPGDPLDQPSGVLLSWDPIVGYTDAQFKYYQVSRLVAADVLVDVDDPLGHTNAIVAELPAIDDTSYADLLPASGTAYVFGVRSVVTVDGITRMSPRALIEASVTFDATIICDARRGASVRAVLPYRKDREIELQRDQSFETPWGQSKPTEIRSRQWSRVLSCEFQILGETPDDVAAVYRALEQMDYAGEPLCWRDGRRHRFFGTITSLREIDPPGGRVQRVVISFRQTNAREVLI